ncbi:hypothetical protein V2H45_18435 [Tumidithrix elongata RA019]|uniref:SWIM-type domain-containing protein n=1 Tax=Tumidithrix elongata BACA0141 TaxID=2716417 RepID=A0AAW9Q4B2_9CYAN|nr:hypothetical protein [Tumidithrix elongata RA019]
MVTSQNILYSASAIARVLNVAASAVVKFDVFAKVVWVYVKGQRPQFLSKKLFTQHFVDRRKAEARGLTVTRHAFESSHFTVRNELKGTSYQVQAIASGLVCECEDYKNQVRFFGRGCCKHGYAVLAQLGFTDLRSYLASQA